MIRIDLSMTKDRDLKTLIRKSLQPTVLEHEVVCENCDKKSEKTEKSSFIRRLPPYLLISINLTNYNSFYEKPQKILEKINPLMHMNIVNLFKELDPNHEKNKKNVEIEGDYKLYAVIVHEGDKADCGHYYTIARNLESESDKGWFLFNDKVVTAIEGELVLENILQRFETPTIFFFENSKKKAIESNLNITIRDTFR